MGDRYSTIFEAMVLPSDSPLTVPSHGFKAIYIQPGGAEHREQVNRVQPYDLIEVVASVSKASTDYLKAA